ncbi:MAG: phenylacetate--CoA ligase [Deferribacterales bacterium]|nr:phenylacetate--CoA ligase [Deferribacterales bacterium]
MKALTDKQKEGFERTAARIMKYNPDYAREFNLPKRIDSYEDLAKLPFLTKDMLRIGYPFKYFCADRASIVRMHMSSGTTGTPIINPMTAADVANWSDIMYRCMVTAGLTANDVIQITPSFGLFNGGFGFHYGAEKLGAFTIPAGAGRSSLQLKLIKDFGVTALGAIASYLLRLMEVAAETGFDFSETRLKTGIFGAEVWSDGMRDRIENTLGIKTYDIVGMTESGGVGMGIDCSARNGIHIWDDYYIIEIINPTTGEPVADGTEGELVITAIEREGLPLIRYRTRDITKIIGREKCSCGLETVRIDRLKGRSDDMLKVKGVNFYPSQIESILMTFNEVSDNYLITIDGSNGKDNITIAVETKGSYSHDLHDRICGQIYDTLSFHADLQLVPFGSLQRSEGKAKRVTDKRKQ